MPETRDPKLRRGADVLGTLLATAGLAAIVFGLVESSQYGWVRRDDGSLSPVIVALVGGLVLMAIWAVVERARERADKVVQTHLGLWRIGNFRNGAIASFVITLGEFGMLFTMPLVLQGAMGYDPLGTGWLMMVLAIGTFVMSAGVPQLAKRLGNRAVVRIGVLLEAIAVAGIAFVLPGGFWPLALCLFVCGLGVGMATAQVTNVMLAEVPVGLSGEASGLHTTVRQLGSAVGVAVLGGLLITMLTSGTETHDRSGRARAGACPGFGGRARLDRRGDPVPAGQSADCCGSRRRRRRARPRGQDLDRSRGRHSRPGLPGHARADRCLRGRTPTPSWRVRGRTDRRGPQAARQRGRSAPGVSRQTIGVPVSVVPTAPSGEQYAPGETCR